MSGRASKGGNETNVMGLPEGLTVQEQSFPVVFVETEGMDITRERDRGMIDEAIYKALQRTHSGPVCGQALLKVHVGEPKCVTRMRPEYVKSSTRFLRDAGASDVVAGDTTVAYSGPRGRRQNPFGTVSPYLELARGHGWSQNGLAGIPFVVLDRPCSAVPGQFEFDAEEQPIEVPGITHFSDFFLAGGFVAADFVVNHAHLTLHGLAGVAGCVKSIAMGCSSLTGKLRLHQSLLPYFDSETCTACGLCVESCPEDALHLAEDASCPSVDAELCIGCGECEAVCPTGTVELRGEEITDWQRGEDTLPVRMADYTVALMNGKWENTVHVLHMYTITERCDCLDTRQEPMLKRDLGFLVGKNPFAIDKLAAQMLADALRREGREADNLSLNTAETAATYVEQVYGILCKVPLEKEVAR